MSITALAKQKFAASALALSMVFSPMASNDAQAADHSASVSTTSTEMKFERTIPRPTLPAKFRGANYRTDNPAAQKLTNLFRQDVPSAASDDRLSLTIYGGNSNTKAAVQDAGRVLAKRLIGVTYIELDDNDRNPNTAKILICADGRCVKEINTPIDFDVRKITDAVLTNAVAAYREQIEPYLVDKAPLPTLAAN